MHSCKDGHCYDDLNLALAVLWNVEYFDFFCFCDKFLGDG